MTQNQKDMIADLQLVAASQGTASRSMYKKNGKYSERQIRKEFGTFGKAQAAAGCFATPTVAKGSTTDTLNETNEFVGDTWNLTRKAEQDIRTLPQLIKYCDIDLTEWEVERWVCNKWAMGYKDDKGKAQSKPLWQVKATLIRRRKAIDAREEIEAIKAEAKKSMPFPRYLRTEQNFTSSGNLLELMLPDLHAGKLSWSKETGYADYDTKIAVDTYRRALDSLLFQTSAYNFDKIVLGVGNDLLQSDNIQGTTYSGTKVDTDSRFHKVYVTVRKMLTETIEKLRLIAPVEVKLIPGNHDTLSTFTMGDSLECAFVNYPDVEVDNSPTKGKTIEWGKVLLTLVHGHEGKQTDYGMWQASKYPEAFGRTKFREIHVGHKHKSALDEKFGTRVRTLSALCPPDAWHSDNIFTGNLRVAEALVWNKERGLIAQFYHTETD